MATTLQGSRVRHRMAELGWTMEVTGQASGIPPGTLKNVTRPQNPDPVSLKRAYDLLRALNQPGLEPLTIEDILAPQNEDEVTGGGQTEGQKQETNTGPKRRENGKSGTGPKPTGAAA